MTPSIHLQENQPAFRPGEKAALVMGRKMMRRDMTLTAALLRMS